MKRLLFILTILLFTSPARTETLQLSPGHQKVVSATEIRRAAIGNPKVADVKVLPGGKQVIVTGVGNGSTDLRLWLKSGTERVYTIQVGAVGRSGYEEVHRLLDGIEGITLKQTGGKIVIDGQVFRSEDLERIRNVLTLYPSVKSFARVNTNALQYFAQQVTESLKQAGFSTIQVNPAGDSLYLEGEVPKKTDIDRAERIALAKYSKITNKLTSGIEGESLVLVDVKMMEIRKSSLSNTGIKWPGQFAATSMASWNIGGAATANLGGTAVISLQALVEKGYGKILSNPKLLCRHGTPASFFAGGQLPIRLTSERTASVTFKSYGISLNVTAQMDHSNGVFMEIETKISDLDQATALDGIPGILEHNVKTALDMKLGETIVLGGLFENRDKKTVSKIPLLGHIPILGELFKSRSFQNNESEFLIFLTPVSGRAGGVASDMHVKQIKANVQKHQKEMEFSILD